MSEDRRPEVREPPERRRVRPGRRVPAWLVVPLTTAVGYVVSGWAGGVFGLLVGIALWWSRR